MSGELRQFGFSFTAWCMAVQAGRHNKKQQSMLFLLTAFVK
jgi:hypothetical protein